MLTLSRNLHPAFSTETDGSGLLCPQCGSAHLTVKDSRAARGTVRRRRACNRCGLRFTTYEIGADMEELIRFDMLLQSMEPRDLMLLRGLAKQMRESRR